MLDDDDDYKLINMPSFVKENDEYPIQWNTQL